VALAIIEGLLVTPAQSTEEETSAEDEIIAEEEMVADAIDVGLL